MKKINYFFIITVFFSSLFFSYTANAQPVYRTIKRSNALDSKANKLSALEYEMTIFARKADMMLQKVDDLISEVEFLRSRNNEYVKIIAAKENEIYNLQKQLREIEQARGDITKAITQYSSQIGSLKLALGDKDKETGRLEAELLDKDKDVKRKIDALKDEISISQKKSESDIAAIQKKSELGLLAKAKIISQKEDKIEGLQAKYAAIENSNKKNIGLLDRVREDLDTRQKELSVLRKQLGKQKDAFKQENSQLKEQIKESTGQLRTLKRQESKYKRESNIYLKTVENLKQRLGGRQKQIAALQKKLYQQKRMGSRLKSEDVKDIARQALDADYDELHKEIDQSRQKIKELKEKLAAKDKALIMLQDEVVGGTKPHRTVSRSSMDKIIAVKNARLAELQNELDKFRSGSSGHLKTVRQMQQKLESREDEMFALQKKFLAIKHEFASIKADKNIKVENVRQKDKQIDKLKKQLKISQSRFQRAVMDYKKKIERAQLELITAKRALSQKVGRANDIVSSSGVVSEKEKELRFLHNKLQRARLSHQELSIDLKKQKNKYQKQITTLKNQLKSAKALVKGAAKTSELKDSADIGSSKSEKRIMPKEAAEPLCSMELEKMSNVLHNIFRNEIKNSKMKLISDKDNIIISVFADVLFDSGDDEVRFSSIPLLNKIGGVCNDQVSDYDMVIEGHTDNQPIRYSQWKSNWELSSARALSILHYFINESGIDSSRLSMTGLGEFKPIATNETESGRQQNRRVEIILVPK